MVSIADVEVTGLQSLIRKLDSLGADTNAIIKKGLHQGAKAIQADAKELVPKKTGRLAGSISVEKTSAGYAVGTNTKYAPFVEFGTGTEGDPAYPHTQRSAWRYRDEQGKWHYVKAMKPRPYMQPAFKKNKTRVVKIVRNLLWQKLKQRIR